MGLLSGMNNARYGALLDDLNNAFSMGRNEYPQMLTSAHNLAINWKGDTKGFGVTPNGGVAFTTEAEEADVHATDGVRQRQPHRRGYNHRKKRNRRDLYGHIVLIRNEQRQIWGAAQRSA